MGKSWINIQFNGAAKGNLGCSGIGCAILVAEDNILALGAKALPIGTNNVAEFS